MTRFLPLPEAAPVLGLSQSALRRRLRAGKVQGQQEPTDQGFRWLIQVPDDDAPSAPQFGATAAPTRPTDALAGELAAAREAITRLETNCADLRTANARLETELDARREEVSRLIVVVREAQRALPAPTLDAQAPPEREPSDATAAPTPTAGIGWWRRLWGQLATS